MKLAVIRKETYSSDLKSFTEDWSFVENGKSKHEVEVENLAVKPIIVRDIVNGTFGNIPDVYKWTNRPEKIVKGTTIIKKNYTVL